MTHIGYVSRIIVLMPREHAPQPRSESTSHERVVAERRAYLEQQAARSMGALVGDLARITSGKDVAEYLVNYPQVDFGADEPSVYAACTCRP